MMIQSFSFSHIFQGGIADQSHQVQTSGRRGRRGLAGEGAKSRKCSDF
jgi:hypothetical protein